MSLLKKEQQVILSLLKEIDRICRKEKIDYYLSPRLTLCAVTGQPFPSDPMAGEVLMKVGEMERFRQAAEDRISTGRALESMKSHKWFPGFYLRYEDTSTLCFHMDAGRDYEIPALGINVLPLRTEVTPGNLRRQNAREEKGWLQLCGKVSGEKDFRDLSAEMAVTMRCAGGQERLGNKLYDEFCRRQQNPDADAYFLKQGKMTTVFPAKIFRKTEKVELEGEEFPVPHDIRGYLRIFYGDDYLNRKEPVYVEPPQMIVSAYMSWEKFSRENEGLEQMTAARLRRQKRLEKDRKRGKYLDECWDYALFCQERIRLGAYYKKKKDYILNLYKDEDYLTLEQVFKPYSKMMLKSLLKEEVFLEDEEIFDIYMDVLEKTGKAAQKSQIRELI